MERGPPLLRRRPGLRRRPLGGGPPRLGAADRAPPPAGRARHPALAPAAACGGGPSLQPFTGSAPPPVGSPEQVVERSLAMADSVGDYQRQMFLMDHAGLPHRTVMEQIELLGTEVVPVL